MGDAENALPSSKKRAAGREISRDNPGDDEEDFTEQETGTFKRASDEVLAGRRIVKVRRNQSTSTPSVNPFAGIQLVPPTAAPPAPAPMTTEVVAASENVSEGKIVEAEKGDVENSKLSEDNIDAPVTEAAANEENAMDKEAINEVTEAKVDKEETAEEATESKVDSEKQVETTESKVNNEGIAEDAINNSEKAVGDDKKESEDKKDNGSENENPSAEGNSLSSFQQLSSSQNAFTGLAGTGFSSSTFSFGSVAKDGSAFGGSLFGKKTDQPSFGFGLSNNGSSSVPATGSSVVSKAKGSGFPSMQEVPVETGEENENVVFFADAVLFEFLDGAWKERGKGEIKVNVSTTDTERARLLMRARGNFRLILNASLFPDMKLTNMDKRGITFACVNGIGEGKDSLSTFALKFKDGSLVEEFCAAVTAHKGKTATVLKTPENSPKASDE